MDAKFPDQEGFVSQAYQDIYDKVKNGEMLSEKERLMYGHEYIQRYHHRILTNEEKNEFISNKALSETVGVGFAISVPVNVALLFLTKYNPAFARPAKFWSLLTIAQSTCFSYTLQAQRAQLDKLSIKYFDDYSDDELVTYDQIQQTFMI